MIQCGNCDWWANSPITSRESQKHITRRCVAKLKRIQSDTKSCRYFKPLYFHCDKYNCRLTFDQCLSRRRNVKNLSGYAGCKNCRQFEKEIREIIEAYYLETVPIVTPRHLARGNELTNQIGSGKIKRRKKKEGSNPNGKRKIKRREKPQSNGKRRKIKRRSKPKAPDKDGLTYTVCPECGQQAMRVNFCRVCKYQKPRRKIKRRQK